MLEFLVDLASGQFPRRWDGKRLSDKGTIRSAFRLVSGAEPRITGRWALYSTAVSESHLWIGRTSVFIVAISPSAGRKPAGNEQMSLDPDFAVIPITTRSGARLEWAMRSGELGAVIRRLGSVTVD